MLSLPQVAPELPQTPKCMLVIPGVLLPVQLVKVLALMHRLLLYLFPTPNGLPLTGERVKVAQLLLVLVFLGMGERIGVVYMQLKLVQGRESLIRSAQLLG